MSDDKVGPNPHWRLDRPDDEEPQMAAPDYLDNGLVVTLRCIEHNINSARRELAELGRMIDEEEPRDLESEIYQIILAALIGLVIGFLAGWSVP